jgi:anti-sigma regulatory factor (Ser/Thr protein kinase)
VLNLRLNSRPDTARLVRAVLGGIAKPFALRPELLNDLKTVVSEACNNAVDHAYRGESGAIAVRVDIQLEEIEVTVRDWGGGFQQLAQDLLPNVLEPLTSALAARSRFSLERFSDVYIVTRAVYKHVGTAASSSRVSFSLTARDQRLELTIGPLGVGTGERLQAIDPDADNDHSVAELADEIAFEQLEHSELLRVVVIDRERDLSGTRGQP